eukprot:Nk52_evm49s255 gene=Nk52_evmTU49s255
MDVAGDADLDAIRARRLAELQSGGAGTEGGVPGMSGGMGNNRQQQAEEAKKREEEMKLSILSQILTQEARARLGRIKSVKPDKAGQIESMLVRMAQMGQIGGQVDEPQLIGFLNQVSQKQSRGPKVNFNRRYADSDEDDDENDDSDDEDDEDDDFK